MKDKDKKTERSKAKDSIHEEASDKDETTFNLKKSYRPDRKSLAAELGIPVDENRRALNPIKLAIRRLLTTRRFDFTKTFSWHKKNNAELDNIHNHLYNNLKKDWKLLQRVHVPQLLQQCCEDSKRELRAAGKQKRRQPRESPIKKHKKDAQQQVNQSDDEDGSICSSNDQDVNIPGATLRDYKMLAQIYNGTPMHKIAAMVRDGEIELPSRQKKAEKDNDEWEKKKKKAPKPVPYIVDSDEAGALRNTDISSEQEDIESNSPVHPTSTVPKPTRAVSQVAVPNEKARSEKRQPERFEGDREFTPPPPTRVNKSITQPNPTPRTPVTIAIKKKSSLPLTPKATPTKEKAGDKTSKPKAVVLYSPGTKSGKPPVLLSNTQRAGPRSPGADTQAHNVWLPPPNYCRMQLDRDLHLRLQNLQGELLANSQVPIAYTKTLSGLYSFFEDVGLFDRSTHTWQFKCLPDEIWKIMENENDFERMFSMLAQLKDFDVGTNTKPILLRLCTQVIESPPLSFTLANNVYSKAEWNSGGRLYSEIEKAS